MGRGRGGPQLGSGAPAGERRDWVRSVGIRVTWRPREAADLRRIAEGWGVPVSCVIWAVVSDWLARLRRDAPELGKVGLAAAAATRLLRQDLGSSK